VVAGCVLIVPGNPDKLEFMSPAGALRLLADVAIAHVLFFLPLFAWRKPRPLVVSTTAAAAVALSMAVATVVLNNLVGLGWGELAALVGFVALAAAGAVIWSEALRERPAVYYGVAAICGLGIPLVLFFARELLRVEAPGVGWFSPFTAWRAAVDDGAWAPWGVFGADLAIGVVWAAAVRRRARA
jgi:hypothetical protein